MKSTLFADDITIYTAGKNLETSQNILQESLNILQTFSDKAGFEVTQSKTTLTIFSR